jgi:hypothetical protein
MTTFSLPGLAISSLGKSTKGFRPAESLSAFRARTGEEAGVLGGEKRRRFDEEGGEGGLVSGEKGGAREKVVLGAAVRSVRPVALSTSSPSAAATSSRPSFTVTGAATSRKKPRLGVSPLVTARRAEGGVEEDKESAEARLRAIYRSLD